MGVFNCVIFISLKLHVGQIKYSYLRNLDCTLMDVYYNIFNTTVYDIQYEIFQ